jgi:hypothetical protein
MSHPPKPGEVDILTLIEEVHGGSPEALRDAAVSRAVTTLEHTHRRAAEAMRHLTFSGVPAQRSQLQSNPAEPAAMLAPTGATTPKNQPAEPVVVQLGEGADVKLVERTLTQIIRPRGKG